MRTGVTAIAVLALVLLGTWGIMHFKTFQPAVGQSAWTSPAELTGYIWAGVQNDSTGARQGMGWISLNCANQGAGGCARDYKVVINNNSTRTVTGYAWGSNTSSTGGTAPANQTGLGWVRFGGLSGCPGTGSCDARVVGNDTDGYELMGWARACSVFADPAACSGALAASTVTGGWDGWISLNCANHESANCTTYQVRMNDNGTFYQVDPAAATAWGSDVLGMVSFGLAGFERPCAGGETAQCIGNVSEVTGTNMWCEEATPVSTTCPNGCNATTGLCNGTALTGELVVSAPLVRRNTDVTISWDMTTSGAGSCVVTGPGLPPTGVTALSGSESVTITLNQSTYTLSCDGVPVDTAVVRMIPDVYES